MISDTVGTSVIHQGHAMQRTHPRAAGHVVYGPYTTMTHGVYQVDFTLALVHDRLPDQICAILDVSADWGNISIVERPVRTSELARDVRTFSLLFVLRDVRNIEFRVLVNGTAEVLAGDEPVLTRISGVLDEPPRDGLVEEAGGLEALGRDTRRILGLLRPEAVASHGKVRLGNPGDGGYVCIDDFAGIDTAFSFGINDDISWDLDAADRGLTIYQFDHTVADPAPHDPRMVFEAKRIDATSGDDRQSLADLIRRHDKRDARPNIILKMDIEGGEWPVLDATSADDLSRIAWMVCEFHYFQGLAQRHHRDIVDRCLRKLSAKFGLVHVHANVWGGITSLANVIFPDVIEVTLVNRELYRLSPTDETFPTAYDQSCDPAQPDLYIGTFRF